MRLPEGVRRYLIHLLECDAAERAQATAELDALAEAAKGHAARPLPDTLRGWLNDAENHVRLVIDRDALAHEYFGCHPCVNTTSLRLSVRDLTEKILKKIRHEPMLLHLS